MPPTFFTPVFGRLRCFRQVRFKTRFFLAVCPPKQKPFAAIDEMQNIEFVKPSDALELWRTSQVLIAPPVLISLQTLAERLLPQKRGDAENLNNKRTEKRIQF